MYSLILILFGTSSWVNISNSTSATLGFLCGSGAQSLTGLKLILRCDMEEVDPALPLSGPSNAVTLLRDMVGGVGWKWDPRLPLARNYYAAVFLSNGCALQQGSTVIDPIKFSFFCQCCVTDSF